MKSYIYENLSTLKTRHYVRKAGTHTYWFDFMQKKLQGYVDKYGSNFCMVIYGSESKDDAYVLPYADVLKLFLPENLSHQNDRVLWMGDIRDNIMRVRLGRHMMSISEYYNAYHLLDEVESNPTKVREQKELYAIGKQIHLADLQRKIQDLNTKFREQAPYKQRMVSDRIARPGEIADYVKKLQNYTCQICHERGFNQPNGLPYVEAHHIAHLHQLLPGSYCSDNIVIVCANCHSKFHYASVAYSRLDDLNMEVSINGDTYKFRRNVITEVP